MSRPSAVVLALSLLATPLLAQVATRPDTTLGDTLLVDRTLSGVADSFRVQLAEGGQYRIVLTPGTATLTAISADKRASSAFPARVREGSGVTPTLIELYPPRTAEYIVRISASTGLAGGRVQLWSDRKLAEEKRASRDRAWGLGVGLAGGWHSGFYTGADDENSGQSGSVLEGCLLVGSSGPVSGCLGFTTMALGSNENKLTWFFLEPRFRVTSLGSPDRPLDVIISARIGQGNSERLSVDPSMLAPGVIVSYHLDSRPGARGWRLNFQALYALLGNVDTPNNSNFAQLTLGLAWIP
jgi:hypothetical protein